jgi:hypothetical protein
MSHPWYRQSLPPYLSLSAEQFIKVAMNTDENVLAKVVNVIFFDILNIQF